MPALYIISTPLGNLEDVTLRAIRMFREINVFFAEDTREAKKLFDLLEISTEGKRFFSYASHNLLRANEDALDQLAQGKDIGFICDRGTPGISDPGARLVREARQREIMVVPIPGVSSLATLVSLWGNDDGRFTYVGFLPRKGKDREAALAKIESTGLPFLFFESPERVLETVTELAGRYPKGKLLIGREMTKAFEQFREFSLAPGEWEKALAGIPAKGEFALICDPAYEPPLHSPWREAVQLRLAPEKEWAKNIAAQYEMTASEVYNELQRRKKDPAAE